MGLVNHLRTPKLWQWLMETAVKHKNDEFFVIPLKHVLCLMGLAYKYIFPNIVSLNDFLDPASIPAISEIRIRACTIG
jgi:hypothetical protein